MKANLILLVLGFALAGCETPKKPPVGPPPPLVPVPVAGTDLDQTNIENVRVGESLKAYPLGRLVDPNNPNVMHEAHTIYRRESGPNWNLNPNAPTVVPLGPVLAVADPARQPSPLTAELEQKIAEQNQLMASLIEQNEALAMELARLHRDIAELRIRQAPPGGEETP